MSDRELLELAAKAAGLRHVLSMPYHDDCGLGGWNPLTDDGDALRLAVKLRIDVNHNHSADSQRWVVAERSGCEGCHDPVCCVEDCFDEGRRFESTRRAITRAAAEIGKAMP